MNKVNGSTTPIKSHLAVMRQSIFGLSDTVTMPLEVLHAYSRGVDEALRKIYLHRLDPESLNRNYCLVALGGYGRKELWPFSDIDILILCRSRRDPDKLSPLIKDFWNLGLSVGSVVRTLEECHSIMGEDIATDTALLEARYLGGNRHLFEMLHDHCLRPYFERNKEKYIDEISATLREGLFSSENSLYRIEPDLKNGICTLRDCQRLLWAERVRRGTVGFVQLHKKSGFSATETRRLESGYAFLAGLRSTLHMEAGQRLDVLETQYHHVIASHYSFGQNGAGPLLEVFFKTVRDIRLSLLSFLEKDLSGKSIWHNVRRRMSSVEIAPGIALLDGIVFPMNRKGPCLNHPEALLNIFKQSLICQGTFSVELRNRLRQTLDAMSAEDFRTRTANEIFLEILSWPGPIGQTLLMMHETGLLSKLIPSFASLTCKVEYDQYHEFPVDQHSLLALCACDDLAYDPDQKIRTVYENLESKLVLRLAVLLHDIGKAMPGDHVQSGQVIAEAVCERLGLADDLIEQIRILVVYHLDMSNLSLLRDFDDHNLSKFVRDIGCQIMLNYLYLLTIVDIRSVGHNTWTGWKAYQLEQLYDRVADLLHKMGQQKESVHLGPTDLYPYKDVPADEKPGYRQCLACMKEDGIGFHQEVFTGFERLTVCAFDRVGFLSDIIGCMTSEGYNILSAKIHSSPDGRVLDVFHLEPPERPRLLPRKRLDNIRRKWQMIAAGQTDADGLVRDRIKKYPPPLLRTAAQDSELDVRVINGDSTVATIVEIATADNFGLVHKIARCFYEGQLNIIAAKLSTRNDQARDVFYITDLQKNKITHPDDVKSLIGGLKKRLTDEPPVYR